MAGTDDQLTLARVAERAERYDDMVGFMIQAIQMRGAMAQLTTEERDMLSAAFKGQLQSRRQAVRCASQVEIQGGLAGHAEEFQKAHAANYRSMLNAELLSICQKAIDLLETTLLVAATPGDAKTFYLKMMGDYYRYMAESLNGELRDQAAINAMTRYGQGVDEAAVTLPSTHPVRLGLALNLSVFQHEVLQDTASAIISAHNAYSTAAAEIAGDAAKGTEDVYMTLQLLRDNLELWQRENY